MKINYTGFLVDPSGYGEAARRLICAAVETGCDVRLRNLLVDEGWKPSQADMPEWLVNFLKSRPHEDPDVHVIHCPAQKFPDFAKGNGRQIGLFCWENDRLPQSVIDGCKAVSQLIVPSMFMQKLCKDAGLDASVIPYPMQASPTAPTFPDARLLDKGQYKFYTITTWQPRKNPLDLLIAYLTEFTANEPVTLFMKVSGPNAGYAYKTALEESKKLAMLLNVPSPPSVKMVGGQYLPDMIWGLHTSCDCFVSMTRGEAFGLPMLDAMSLGKPVIAPGFGGHADFLDNYPGWRPVPFRMRPVLQKYEGFSGMQGWADPDVMALRRLMREEFTVGKRTYEPDMFAHSSKWIGRQLKERLSGD